MAKFSRYTHQYDSYGNRRSEDELNRILEKISEKGIKSLTKQEQQF